MIPPPLGNRATLGGAYAASIVSESLRHRDEVVGAVAIKPMDTTSSWLQEVVG